MSFDWKVWYETNKEDQNAKQRARYHKNKERYSRNMTENMRRRKYNMDHEAMDLLLELQCHECQLCSTPVDRKSCIDHDHKNGRVRGILCRPCNMALGLLKDNTITMAKAINYIKRNND